MTSQIRADATFRLPICRPAYPPICRSAAWHRGASCR